MSPAIRHFARHYAQMVLAMLLRRDEYSGHAHAHGVIA